ESQSIPLQPIADRAVVDVHRREAADRHAVRCIHDAALAEVELMHFYLGAGIGEKPQPRIRIPGKRFHLPAYEVLDAVFRLGTGRPVDDKRLDPASGPAADPDL